MKKSLGIDSDGEPRINLGMDSDGEPRINLYKRKMDCRT